MKKRGLSPVIASVLLIMLVLVLAAIIFLWARGFIAEQIEKFGKPVESLCNDVNFEFDLFIDNVGSGYEVEIVNRGDIPIQSFDVKAVNGGDSEIQKFDFRVDPGKAERRGITFTQFETMPEKITIYPALLGNIKGKRLNKAFTCVEKGETKYFNEL